MASYAGHQPTDGGSKKFAGVLVNNAGVNEFVATRGVNRSSQNGETVGDLVVAPAGVYATGQAPMANSLPVVVASDQSSIPTNLTRSITQHHTVIPTGSTPTLIAGGMEPHRVIVLNRSTAPVYIGGDDVTVDNGFYLPTNASIDLTLGAETFLFGCVLGSIAGEVWVLELVLG